MGVSPITCSSGEAQPGVPSWAVLVQGATGRTTFGAWASSGDCFEGIAAWHGRCCCATSWGDNSAQSAGLNCCLASVMLLAMRCVSLVLTAPSVAAAAGAASARIARRRGAARAAGAAACTVWMEHR